MTTFRVFLPQLFPARRSGRAGGGHSNVRDEGARQLFRRFAVFALAFWIRPLLALARTAGAAVFFARAMFVAGPFAVLRAAVFRAEFGFAATRAGGLSVFSSGVAMPASSSSPSGSEVSRGSPSRFTGCQVCSEPTERCFAISLAASSWVRRPRWVYIPGFTLFCLLICGTVATRPRRRCRRAGSRLR